MTHSTLPRLITVEDVQTFLFSIGYRHGDVPVYTENTMSAHSYHVLSGMLDAVIFPRPEDMPVDVRHLLDSGIYAMTEHTAWLSREAGRFLAGVYNSSKLLSSFLRAKYPNAAAKYWYHFAHVSLDNPGDIAYTPGYKYGVADRQVHMKIGRYLTKFYSDILSPEIIRDLSNVAKPRQIMWALDIDDMVFVYANGPQSCMKDKNYAIEPYGYVYPNGTREWAVAYLFSPIQSTEEIVARTLVNMRHKIFTRLYGDDGPILESLLQVEGFSKVDGMHDYDSRLLYLPYENSDFLVCMPYLDGNSQSIYGPLVDENNVSFFHWGRKNSPSADCHCGDAAGGVVDLRSKDNYDNDDDDNDNDDDDRRTCDECSNPIDDDDERMSEYHADCLCERCNDNARTYAYYGAHDDQTYVDNDDVVLCETNDAYYLNMPRVLDYHDLKFVTNGDLVEVNLVQTLIDGDTVNESDHLTTAVGERNSETIYVLDDAFEWDRIHARLTADNKLMFVHVVLIEEGGYDRYEDFHDLLYWGTRGYDKIIYEWIPTAYAADSFDSAVQSQMPLLETA